MINKRQVQNILSQCFNLTIFFRNFVISCFQKIRKWLQHSILSGNFTRVEKSWILFKTKFKSSIPNINYLAPLFMHCYSCSKITILVLLSPRHLKWHIWLRGRGCAYVWLLQIYTRLPSSIYSCSLNHILEHEFICLGCLGSPGSEGKKVGKGKKVDLSLSE